MTAVPDAFSGRRSKDEETNEVLLTSLYEQIGRQKVDLEWLKKAGALDLRSDAR